MNLFSPQEARMNRQAGLAMMPRLCCHGGRMLKK
jgi:hypothetical protein